MRLGVGGVAGANRERRDLFLIDFPQPARPVSHIITGRISGLHHGSHVSPFLLLTCV